MQRRDRARHELGNVLGIVLANLEGMADGIVEPTKERLESLARSIRKSKEILLELEEPAVPADDA